MEGLIEKLEVAKYPVYKDSGVAWLGEIPGHWETTKLKYIALSIADKRKSKESNLSYIGMENIESWTSKFIETSTEVEGLANYFEAGDILFGKLRPYLAKVYLAKHEGICSTEFLVYRILDDFKKIYLKNVMLSKSFIDIINSSTYGSKMPRANSGFIGDQIIPFPPLPEQTAIANFLDRKTTLIDQAIAIKQKQIELLNERRQILINKAVTRGLDPNVKLKDSGVEWIGEIPEGWEVKRLKYVLDERNERSKEGLEPLFMMSQVHGLVVRSDFHEKAEVALSNEGNKIVRPNDLVFNKLKAHLGVFFKSEIKFDGIVSPDYAVYFSKGLIEDLKYLELLFRNPGYIKEFICRATGIVEGLIRLYTHDLFDIQVPIPPIKEQSEILLYISEYSNKIMSAISLKEKEIEKLKEYKATLINSAVTGKIKVY